MSKINAVRIINLNYNNNAIRVSDETFQLGGQSTLLSLRNGGGKSVLVQMMTAPFVHKQYRKTKDRPFESYFSTSKPTFILVEWALDQGAGYCLTGMMVRRSQVSEEQSSEPLEIINFISEYTARCEHDIYNIPVVEKAKNEIVLKNFNACRQLFEMYKKDHSKKFLYYDMNNHAQQKQYFDKLAEYKIYYKEWENIIRKVNLKESGLSELFSDCKNEKELLEKWFIKTIESKLNGEQDRIKEFQTIIEKYVHMYKDNKSKIERRDTIMQFKEDMEVVQESAGKYLETEENVKAYENRIACLAKELSGIGDGIKTALDELEEKSLTCEDEIARILYEKMSVEFHKLNDELLLMASKRDMTGWERDEQAERMAGIENTIHKYECARQQINVNEQKEEYEIITQKIDVSRKNEQELEPERRRLGGYLKSHYTERNAEAGKELERNKSDIEDKEKHCQQYKDRIAECQKNIEELMGKKGGVAERIKGFSYREDEYNRRYSEQFSRNIMGDYEAGLLEIKQDEYEKEEENLVRSSKSHVVEQGDLQEKKKTCQRNKEDKEKSKQGKELELHKLRGDKNRYDEQIKERQGIMRYLDADASLLWQYDRLLELVDRKMSDIDRGKQQLTGEIQELQKEWKKLTSGELMELPQEFKDLLSELDINPVYGMNWLDKNDNTMEENTALVRKQPFLPYALIMTATEIKKLEKHGKDIYTGYPIPIISRDTLDKPLINDESSVLNLQGVSFYIWFNEKLLDEEALQMMISQKESEIQKKNEQLKIRKQEYQDYSDKRSNLTKQSISKELVEENQKRIVETEEEIESLDKQIAGMSDDISLLEQTLEKLAETIQKEKERIAWCRERDNDFIQFCNAYQDYQKNRQEEEQYDKDMRRNEANKKQAEDLHQKCKDELQSLKSNGTELTNKLGEIREKLLKYESYEPKDSIIMNTTAAEAEARYEAITSKMSSELQELEKQQKKAGNNLQKAEHELKRLQDKYGLPTDAWCDVIYNEQEQKHQEAMLEDANKKLERLNHQWNEEDKKIAVLNSQIDNKKGDMLEQCKKEEPLPKEDIRTVDFDGEINKLKHHISELKKEHEVAKKHLDSVNQNLTVLSEYKDFAVEHEVEWESSLADMNEKRLREFVGEQRRDYNNEKDELKRKKGKVEAGINTLLRKEIYQEDYYRKPLETMLSVTEQAKLVLAQINTTLKSYESQMEKLAVDIAMVEKEKSTIEGQLEEYVKEVHGNMAKIDNNSTITVRERPVKMLRLQIPDWEENEGLYRQRLSDYMDELTRGGIEIYERNENATDYFSSRITTKNLYDSIIGIGNIQIKLYKIEEQREYPITWADVSRNSGGEGFLSAFVILSSLLHYMRRDETDIFADRNEGKVLVMDNPFAQTNAVHLLKPLMDMAKKTNTQLICLSGLGGDSIYGRFDNIYVLNLVNASLRGGMQYLRGEHTRGAEEEVMVSSQIEVMEQQMLLF